MADLDTLTRLWRAGRITTADLTEDERRRVHQCVIDQACADIAAAYRATAGIAVVPRVVLVGSGKGGSRKGRTLSLATRARMSLAQTARHAARRAERRQQRLLDQEREIA